MAISPEERDLLVEVRDARSRRVTVNGGNAVRDVSLEGAYRIQREYVAGKGLHGYKLGLISPAKQQQMGVSTPIYGHILDGMIREPQVRLGDFIQPKLEPELALILGSDVAPGTSAGAAWQAVSGLFLGVDILDSIWAGFRFTLAEVVADNTSGGGFVLGQRLHTGMPQGSLRLYLNGTLRAEGPIAALGDPGRQLAWLAGEVGGLKAGQVIFLGSPAAAVPAEPGTLEIATADDSLIIRLEA